MRVSRKARGWLGGLGIALAALAAAAPAARADDARVRISRQPGFVYLPMVLAERHGLIEKHAKAAGLGDVTVEWMNLTSGAAGNDALLSGNLDIVDSGSTNMLLMNDRTRGDVKGLTGVGATPMLLLTRNPDVKTLKDFTSKDKIALPSVKVSSQAVLLQIAAKKTFGPGEATRLDPLTVQLGHPDAIAALSSPHNEVNSHFSLPPFQQRELQDPAIHAVLNSYEMVGEPVSNAILYARTGWFSRNPKLAAAIVAAIDEANAAIAKDPLQAAKDYVASTNEKTPPEQLVAMMKEPGTVFSTTPYGIMLQARHFHEMKTIRTEPKDWKDYFFPIVHGLPGR
ncbi:ABC transporter substrate-binding protein [Methylobacterium sp. NEAU 140]|uniref:ABC transporter substrate-binding protein n=1 Tax=Methylobacterium sp. NEAU 140 TaxID=3064945 RepID=UPI002736EBB7|nr:ABC transporter substrate-binding protein [Methylobacterium sp. NEAU 140]MDP4023367.1 ABC transporter substrate-binding protein [Methylobacterium sp. NEAU 140]